MEKENEHIDELIGKYLAGEASSSERDIVTAWMGQSEENERYFSQLRTIFDTAATPGEWKRYDTDTAWQKLHARIRQNGREVSFDRPARQWWKAAAAVALLLAVSLYLFLPRNSSPEVVQLVSQQRAVSDTLPDGSDVFLNRQSKVLYSYDKGTRKHDVRLEGEAYFNVHHGGAEEFVVRAGDVFIRDIGTSFNVKAYPESDIVEVLVEEGEIVFYTADNPGVHLKESGRAVYNRKTRQFTVDEPDPNITAYKTRFFVFAETSLEEAVQMLNAVYETEIVLGEGLAKCPITVTFRNETVDEVAGVIAETLDLTLTRENGKIILNGKGCE